MEVYSSSLSSPTPLETFAVCHTSAFRLPKTRSGQQYDLCDVCRASSARRLQLATSMRPRGPRGLCVDLPLWEVLRLLLAALRPHPKASRRFPVALGSLPRSQRLYPEAMAPASVSEASPRSSEKPPPQSQGLLLSEACFGYVWCESLFCIEIPTRVTSAIKMPRTLLA